MAKLISPKEVSLHSSLGDCWIIIEGRVYDVSEYMLRHPGGRWIILSNGGKDATEGFMHKIHSLDALQLLSQLYLGDVAEQDMHST